MDRSYRIIFIFPAIFSLNIQAKEVNVRQQSIANLWINGLDHKTDVTLITDQDNFYIPCEVLQERKINISKFQHDVEQATFCLINHGDIGAVFDHNSQSIQLTIPTQYFITGQTLLDQDVIPQKASFGGFLNYDLLYSNHDSAQSYNALSELGIFKDYWILRNSVLYSHNSSTENQFVRLKSSLDIDFPKNMTRLTIGDTTTFYNPLINSLRFGGLSWGTTYTERPNFIYWNMPSLQGSARLPSTVELYINGINIYSQQVSPGDYVLQTGAAIQQSGNAQIVVEDVLGNRSVRSFPILVTNRLLKEGLNEYNVSLGKLRYQYNLKSSDYRDFFSNVFFRRGLTNSTSVGVNLLYSKDIKNLGLMWTQSIKNWFVYDLTVLGSYDKRDKYRASYGVALSEDFGRYSLGLNFKYNERNFKFLGDGLDQPTNYPKFENFAYFSINDVPWFSNISMNYAEQKYYQSKKFSQNKQQVFTIGFNRRIGKNLGIGVSYFNSFGDRTNSGYILSLAYNFDSNKTIYFSHSLHEDTNLQFVKSDSSQFGLDYSVGINRRANDVVYNFDGLWKVAVGDIDFQHRQSTENHETQVNFRGAMVWLNGNVSFTKSVDNAFALVNVGNYPNIDILRSLTYVDKTNKKGYVFIHDIIPYVKYDIAFNQDQLPVEDKIQVASKQITALNQRGYIINFPVFHAKQVVVKLVNAQHQTFAHGTEIYIENDGGEVYPITSDGTVTLYGLIPGKYPIQIKSVESTSCMAELDVTEMQAPTSTEPLELVCQ